jgi:hypothetical protein
MVKLAVLYSVFVALDHAISAFLRSNSENMAIPEQLATHLKPTESLG